MRYIVWILSIINFFSNPLLAQIQTTSLPSPGFEARIRRAVNDIRIIDTHEHLKTEEERIQMADKVDFTYLFSHYAKEDLVSASHSKGIIEIAFNPEFPLADRWELFKPFYAAMRCTGYGRVPLIIARDLFNISEINDQTYAILSEKLKAASSKSGWYHYVLKERAKIDLSIQDGGHRKFDPEFYRHVERFDEFIHVSSGSEITQLGAQYKINIETLADYLIALRTAFQAGVDRGMVGVKSGLAYQRILHYENTPEEIAQTVFKKLLEPGTIPASVDDIKAFQDYMMHRVLDLANEFHLPVQIHTGLQAGNGNYITNSQPTHLINLFLEYPGVNFCIFHTSYPYGGELAVLAKNFPNVLIDMCWTHIISPSFSERYLHEFIETVPANKIMAFGGDYSIVEAVYAHAVMARQVIANVLVEKVQSGYISETEAIDIAQRILHENALEIFRLKGKSRDVEQLAVLNRPGRIKDWWDIHKTKTGFVRNWMVIGPFEFGEGLDQVLPPENEIDFQKRYVAIGGSVTWEKATLDETGYLNFVSIFNKRKTAPADLRGMAYAYTEIESPENRKVTLTLGSNDGAKLWVNGKVVYNEHVGRTAVADQVFLEVSMKKGLNRVLAKVENLGANWGLYLRVVDPHRQFSIKAF